MRISVRLLSAGQNGRHSREHRAAVKVYGRARCSKI